MGGEEDQTLIHSWNMNCTCCLYKVPDTKEKADQVLLKEYQELIWSVEDDTFSKKEVQGWKVTKDSG